jgi:hypothetical protein
VSEIYGSGGGYDRGDSGGRADDYRHGGDAYDMWGDQDPDAANYADPASQNDRVADDDDGSGPDAGNYRDRDEELDRGMNRAEYAEYVRGYEQAGTGNDGDDPWATDPDLANYANGNAPEIAWRNQGNPDSPNGFGSMDTTGQDRQIPQADGDTWGGTYSDAAAGHAENGTAGTWDELMAELDHPHTEATDRPAADDQRPGRLDGQRYPTGVTGATGADSDPGYYDGDIKAALAADTTPPGSKPPARAASPTPLPNSKPLA